MARTRTLYRMVFTGRINERINDLELLAKAFGVHHRDIEQLPRLEVNHGSGNGGNKFQIRLMVTPEQFARFIIFRRLEGKSNNITWHFYGEVEHEPTRFADVSDGKTMASYPLPDKLTTLQDG